MTDATAWGASRELRPAGLLEQLLIVTACAGAAAGALLWSSAPPNHDNAWWLFVTDQVLGGAVFGRDVIEPNPPLFLLVTVPPAALARLFQADAHTLYCLWIGAIIAASAVASIAPLKALGLTPVRAGLCACGFVVIQTFAAGRGFGQREAVMFALAAPFVLNEIARLLRDPPRAAHLPTAAAAALGFLIKPFFAVVPAGLLLLRVVRERNLLAAFSPAYVVMLLMAAAYAGAIILLTPEWFALVPDIASAHPAAFNSTESTLESLSREAVLFAAAAAVAWLAGGPQRPASLLLLGVAILFYVGGALQLKGYDYHLAPGKIAVCFALVVSLVGAPAGAALSKAAKLAGLCLLAFVLARGAVGSGFLHRNRLQTDELAEAVRMAQGQPFMTISPLLTGTFPQVTELDADWGARTGSQWMAFGASAMLRSDDAEIRSEGERLHARAAEMLVDDIERSRPAVIAVARQEGPLGENTDWLQLLRTDAAFSRAWRSYCYARETMRWRIYVRCR